MKYQKYIFFSLIVLFSCKTDVKPFGKHGIQVLHYIYPREIIRQDSSFGLIRFDQQNIKVEFEQLTNKLYKLSFEGVDTISFHTSSGCLYPLLKGDMVDSTMYFQNKGFIDLQTDSLSCTLLDTSYIGVRISSTLHPYQENFGYLRIIEELRGYWIIDEFIYNLENHGSIVVGKQD